MSALLICFLAYFICLIVAEKLTASARISLNEEQRRKFNRIQFFFYHRSKLGIFYILFVVVISINTFSSKPFVGSPPLIITSLLLFSYVIFTVISKAKQIGTSEQISSKIIKSLCWHHAGAHAIIFGIIFQSASMHEIKQEREDLASEIEVSKAKSAFYKKYGY